MAHGTKKTRWILEAGFPYLDSEETTKKSRPVRKPPAVGLKDRSHEKIFNDRASRGPFHLAHKVHKQSICFGSILPNREYEVMKGLKAL